VSDRLASDVRPGHDGAGRLVLVHGFTQTRRSWDGVRDRLGDRVITVAVDVPGHGDSADVRADLTGTAALLAGAGGRATYVGYSMGGRMALRVAVDHPGVVERLVLVSATAGIDDAAERSARVASDRVLAESIERDGVAAFLDRWLALPLFASLPPDARRRDEREANGAAGLASSLRLAGTGTQEPLWDRLGTIDVPVLVVAGALDEKFTALAERMAALLPRPTLAVVEGAGHTVHLERPDEFSDLLGRWLDDTQAR